MHLIPEYCKLKRRDLVVNQRTMKCQAKSELFKAITSQIWIENVTTDLREAMDGVKRDDLDDLGEDLDAALLHAYKKWTAQTVRGTVPHCMQKHMEFNQKEVYCMVNGEVIDSKQLLNSNQLKEWIENNLPANSYIKQTPSGYRVVSKNTLFKDGRVQTVNSIDQFNNPDVVNTPLDVSFPEPT